MPSLSLLSLNHLHLPKCLRALLNGDDLEFCGAERVTRHDDDDHGVTCSDYPPFRRPPSSEPQQLSRRDDNDHRQIGTALVRLSKPPGAILGLTVVGGIDKGEAPHVAALRPGAAAARCDVLCVGDVIVSIDGVKTTRLRHEEIVDLLRRGGDQLRMEIEYPLPPLPGGRGRTGDAAPTVAKTLQVRLRRESSPPPRLSSQHQPSHTSSGGFGLVVRGGTVRKESAANQRNRRGEEGSSRNDASSRPLTIVDLRRGGIFFLI